MQPDFGKTADDYARHRAGFPGSLFVRLRELGVGAPGQRIVDLGTGTGTLARGFAGQGAVVVGVDPAFDLIEQAKRLDAAAGVEVDYVEATAEQTGLPSRSADVVTAGQCWWWFDEPRTLTEVQRVLDTDGMLVIASFDWLPLSGNVVEATEQLIERHNPAWGLGGGDGRHGDWIDALATAGFSDVERIDYEHEQPYSHEAWRGRIRASAGVAGSLSAEAVEAFDREHGAMLAERFPADPLGVPHRVFAVVGRI